MLNFSPRSATPHQKYISILVIGPRLNLNRWLRYFTYLSTNFTGGGKNSQICSRFSTPASLEMEQYSENKKCIASADNRPSIT